MLTKDIEKEQKKLVDHLNKLNSTERERQGFAMLCYLQGYEAGYQSAKRTEKTATEGA